MLKFNEAKDPSAPIKYACQPFVEQKAHELLNEGAANSHVKFKVRVSWTQDQGTRSQDFVYNDGKVSDFINSYGNNRYGKMFTLTLNGAENFTNLTFEAVVVSDLGVEFVSNGVQFN